ncbi:MAG TPA: hypothetical protein VMT43_02200 [Acidimicrobiales bacterium]|nr:hypothetical protein [Acidimicrobiales bacterium]
MRRVASAALVALGLAVVGAACGSAKATPGVPKADFTPKAELLVHSCGVPTKVPESPSNCAGTLLITSPGKEFSAPVITQLPEGSVLVVQSLDSHDRRLQGAVKDQQVFDTGTLYPNDRTVVVLGTPGRMTITDLVTGQHGTLTVEPKPGAKS